MTRRSTTAGFAAALALAGGAGVLIGQATGPGVPAPAGVLAVQEQMDPEAMLRAWQEAGAPDEHHKQLHYFVGQWTTEMKSLMPGGEAFNSTGKASYEMIMGGRFLKSTYEGDMMGLPFTGHSLGGYNKVDRRWEALWMDTVSTAMYYYTGEKTDDGWVYMGSETDPMTRQTMRTKDVITVHGPDHFSFTRHYPNPENPANPDNPDNLGEGDWVAGFKIDYKRKGGNARPHAPGTTTSNS